MADFHAKNDTIKSNCNENVNKSHENDNEDILLKRKVLQLENEMKEEIDSKDCLFEQIEVFVETVDQLVAICQQKMEVSIHKYLRNNTIFI